MLKKRFFLVILCLCMVAGMLPAITLTAQAAGTGIIDKLNNLKNSYPDGSYWTVNGGPCPPPTSNYQHTDHSNCNWYDGASECMGFARLLFYEVFGIKCSTLESQKRYDRENVSVGDYIRLDGDTHSAIVIGRNGDQLTLAECNFGGRCQVKWGSRPSGYAAYISNITFFIHAPQDVYDRVNGTPAYSSIKVPLGIDGENSEDFYCWIGYNPRSSSELYLENRNGNVQTAWKNTNDPRQIWHFIWDDSRSAYKIVNMYDGRCLEVYDSVYENERNVRVYMDNGADAQRWKIIYGADGWYYNFLPYATDSYALDMYKGDINITAGVNIQIFGIHRQASQTYQIHPIRKTDVNRILAYSAGNDFYSRIEFNGTYLQTTGNALREGRHLAMNVVTTATRAVDPRQIWHFIRQDNGSYKIVNEYNGWCLDLQTGIAENNKNIWTWSDDHGQNSERWYLVHSPGDSTYRIVSAALYPTALYSIDIPNSSTSEGTNVELFSQQWGANQQFSISGMSYTRPSKPAMPDNVQVRAASESVTITWDAVPLSGTDNRQYEVWLENEDYNNNPITSFYQVVQGTSCTFNTTLPIGGYTVGVRAVNTMYRAYRSDDAMVDFAIEPEPTTYTVSVSSTEGGTASGGGNYEENTSVSVIATPSTGYQFKEWTESGLQVSTDNPYTFTASADRTLVAVFEQEQGEQPPDPVTYSVSVTANPAAGGTVSGSGTFAAGDSVTVTATAATGYEFKGWTENSNQVSSSASYSFSISANHVLTAVFEKKQTTPQITRYRVEVSASPTESGTVTGGGILAENTAVTVTATPSSGYRFVGWTENGAQVSISASYTFTVTENRALTAIFESETSEPTQEYTISVDASPSTGGSVSGNGSYQKGEPVTITATPNEGYKFKEWLLNGSQVSATASYTFNASANQAYTAVFDKNDIPTTSDTYTISVSANPTTGGTVTGGGSYEENSSVTVTATAKTGYRFTGWAENGSQVSASNPYTFTAKANRSLEARFSYIGGGTSSSGGGPSSSSTTPNIPVSTAETASGTITTASPAASIKGNTATSAVTSTITAEIVKQAVVGGSKNVVISPVIGGSVTRTEVSVPAATLKEIRQKTDADVIISTPAADITIYRDGLNTLSNSGNVTVTTQQTGEAIELTITAGEQVVECVNGGVSLSVPTVGATPGTVAVIIRENGTRQVVRKSAAHENLVTVPLDGSAKVVILDNAKTFADVPETSWAADAVAFASGHELFNGTGSDTFSPDLPMTRGMLAVVLHNLENNLEQDPGAVFSDVRVDAWYYDAVAWAANRGIVSGYGNGLFGPDDNITREQLAVMLWRYAGEPAATDRVLHFNDADEASGYALNALCWATENGIINGKGGGILDPKGQATRAQVAQMLMNYLKK